MGNDNSKKRKNSNYNKTNKNKQTTQMHFLKISNHQKKKNVRATDLFELILYPDTLLKLFIRFRSSLVEFWGHLSILSYHSTGHIPRRCSNM